MLVLARLSGLGDLGIKHNISLSDACFLNQFPVLLRNTFHTAFEIHRPAVGNGNKAHRRDHRSKVNLVSLHCNEIKTMWMDSAVSENRIFSSVYRRSHLTECNYFPFLGSAESELIAWLHALQFVSVVSICAYFQAVLKVFSRECDDPVIHRSPLLGNGALVLLQECLKTWVWDALEFAKVRVLVKVLSFGLFAPVGTGI